MALLRIASLLVLLGAGPRFTLYELFTKIQGAWDNDDSTLWEKKEILQFIVINKI